MERSSLNPCSVVWQRRTLTKQCLGLSARTSLSLGACLLSVGKEARGSIERSLAKSLGSRLTKNSITVLELTIGQKKPVGREETVSVEHFRRRADECRRLASVARNASDKAFWLRLVARWQALEVQKAQQPVRDKSRSPLRRQSELSAAD